MDISHGNTSANAQCSRLLERLQLDPTDTLTARRELNILMPTARIKELKERGHCTHAPRISLTGDQGRPHNDIALYYLTHTGN